MIAIDEVRDYAGGEWRRPSSSNRSEVLNPATGEVIGHAPKGWKRASRESFTVGRRL